jgi:hypothetical protein
LLHEDKDRRPSARDLLYRLYKIEPTKWVHENPYMESKGTESGRISTSIPTEDREYVRGLMKTTAYKMEINRGKKGYGALISLLDQHKINREMYTLYTAVTLMVLSATFGKSGFREQEVINMCDKQYKLSQILDVLYFMLSDSIFVKFLLSP